MQIETIYIMIIMVISKILGFGRDVVLAYYYGASNISDAYIISTTIPSLIFMIIGSGINASFIPIYNDIVKNESIQKAKDFTNNLVNIIFVFCTIIVVLSRLFTEEIIKILASGFDNNTFNIAVEFTKITIFGIYFNCLTYVFTGYLNARRNFLVPSSIGIPLNSFVIISIILSSKISIKLLSYGSVFALAIQLFFLIPFVYKSEYKYSNILIIKDKYIQKMLFLSIPVIIGMSLNQINLIIDKMIASKVIIGGISALNYAGKLNMFIQDVFVISSITVMYPSISKMVVDKDIDGFKSSLTKTINTVSLLVLPASMGSMILAEPIVKLLFGRGSFNTEATILTSSALRYYSVGMIGFGLREVLSRAFYAMQDTKTPVINSALGIALNIMLNMLLSHYMGINGLALATSISAIFTTVIMFMSLSKRIGYYNIKNVYIPFIKVLFASLFMGWFVKFSLIFMLNYFSQTVSILTSIIAGVLFYFTIIFVMKIEDVHLILKRFKEYMYKNLKNRM